jgi:hypothetical protein
LLILLLNINCKKQKNSNPTDQSFKTRPGPRPGSILLKKNQNDVVLVKKKTKKKQKSTGLSPGLAGSAGSPGHIGFFLPPFFHQPGSVPAPGRPGPGSTYQAGPGFKTMQRMHLEEKKLYRRVHRMCVRRAQTTAN